MKPVNKRLEEMRRASEQNDRGPFSVRPVRASVSSTGATHRIRYGRRNVVQQGRQPNHGVQSMCGKSGSHHGADSPCGQSSPHHGADSLITVGQSSHRQWRPNTGEASSFVGTAAKPNHSCSGRARSADFNAPYFCSTCWWLHCTICSGSGPPGFHEGQDHDIDARSSMIRIIQKARSNLANNNIQSITVLRMEVPCCSGLVHAVRNAMLISGKVIPWNVVTISIDGDIISQNT